MGNTWSLDYIKIYIFFLYVIRKLQNAQFQKVYFLFAYYHHLWLYLFFEENYSHIFAYNFFKSDCYYTSLP